MELTYRVHYLKAEGLVSMLYKKSFALTSFMLLYIAIAIYNNLFNAMFKTVIPVFHLTSHLVTALVGVSSPRMFSFSSYIEIFGIYTITAWVE